MRPRAHNVLHHGNVAVTTNIGRTNVKGGRSGVGFGRNNWVVEVIQEGGREEGKFSGRVIMGEKETLVE